jgi:hypothetical protein
VFFSFWVLLVFFWCSSAGFFFTHRRTPEEPRRTPTQKEKNTRTPAPPLKTKNEKRKTSRWSCPGFSRIQNLNLKLQEMLVLLLRDAFKASQGIEDSNTSDTQAALKILGRARAIRNEQRPPRAHAQTQTQTQTPART